MAGSLRDFLSEGVVAAFGVAKLGLGVMLAAGDEGVDDGVRTSAGGGLLVEEVRGEEIGGWVGARGEAGGGERVGGDLLAEGVRGEERGG
jgi:hypothetical protein